MPSLPAQHLLVLTDAAVIVEPMPHGSVPCHHVGTSASPQRRRLSHSQLHCILDVLLLVAVEAPATAGNGTCSALCKAAQEACQHILGKDPFVDYTL